MNRGKKMAFSVMALMLFFVAGLQPVKAQRFNAGVFGGFSGAQVDRDGYGGYTKLGLSGGAFVNREFSDDFYWQLELRYIARGSYYFMLDKARNAKYQNTKFRYIELPLLLQYLHEEKYQFEIGVSPDILIDYVAKSLYKDFSQEEPLGGNRRFGLNALAGFQYWLTDNLGIGLRFSYSIIPYDLKEGVSTRYSYSGYFHNVLAVTGTWKFMHP